MSSQHPPPPSTGDHIDLPPPPPPPLSPSSSDSHRIIPTPFLAKTYQLVDDVSSDAIVSWNEKGTAFVVWNTAEFARDILPKHFKHNNFSSFVRQLNTYGFRKISPDRWEFSHDCFRRGDMRLLCDIVRRKLAVNVVVPSPVSLAAPMEPSASNSSTWISDSVPLSVDPTALMFIDQSECQGSSSRAYLIDENDRLKKKNTRLCNELTQMKSMCTNIYSMMSNYNPGSGLVPGLGHGPGPPMSMPMLGAVVSGSHNSSQAESMMISGQRLLATVEETEAVQAAIVADEQPSLNPSLFGYRQGSTQANEEESTGERVEQDDLLKLQPPG